MGNNKNDQKSRRWFFSLFTGESKNKKPEMVKMLTADGKLVEVEKSLYEKASKKVNASRKDIFNWMENPSKHKD
jgi:hypothetical protein